MDQDKSSDMKVGAIPPEHSPTATAGKEDIGMTLLQQFSLTSSLRQLAERVEQVQTSVAKLQSDKPKGVGHYSIEICKIIFGGWPALGLLFLLLFYSPLKDALMSIPEKVRSAEEIQMAGVSLKMAIKNEAAKLGEISLSETIPSLSGLGIEEILRVPADGDTLWSFTPNKNGDYASMRFRSDEVIETLEELRQRGLVEIKMQTETGKTRVKTVHTKDIHELYSEIRSKHPGKLTKNYAKGLDEWTPNAPIPDNSVPLAQYSLTSSGKQAVEIILKAVAAELAPKDRRREAKAEADSQENPRK